MIAWMHPYNANKFEWNNNITPFSHVAWPVGGGVLYLVMVWVLTVYMRDRKAVDVSIATKFHNLFLVGLSIVLSSGIFIEVVRYLVEWYGKTHTIIEQQTAANPETFTDQMTKATQFVFSIELAVPWYNLNCHKWCALQPDLTSLIDQGHVSLEETLRWCDMSSNPVSGRLYWWIYMAYLWKYYDFVDTALLILKKKQLIFLHVFHHATVPLCAWMAFEGRLLLPLWMGMGINSAVHGLMYYYYYLRESGQKVWWRRHVTQIQTSQFILGAFMTIYGAFHFFKFPKIASSDTGLPYFSYTKGCEAESWAIFTCGLFNLAFLFLFMHWYITTYKAASTRQTQASTTTLCGHEKTC
jgi:hypothetical protein